MSNWTVFCIPTNTIKTLLNLCLLIHWMNFTGCNCGNLPLTYTHTSQSTNSKPRQHKLLKRKEKSVFKDMLLEQPVTVWLIMSDDKQLPVPWRQTSHRLAGGSRREQRSLKWSTGPELHWDPGDSATWCRGQRTAGWPHSMPYSLPSSLILESFLGFYLSQSRCSVGWLGAGHISHVRSSSPSRLWSRHTTDHTPTGRYGHRPTKTKGASGGRWKKRWEDTYPSNPSLRDWKMRQRERQI